MAQKELSADRLAAASRDLFADYPVAKTTIQNWRTGQTQTAQDWRSVAVLAQLLGLNEHDANKLLESLGCFTVDHLRPIISETDQRFLQPWSEPERHSSAKLPTSFRSQAFLALTTAGVVLITLLGFTQLRSADDKTSPEEPTSSSEAVAAPAVTTTTSPSTVPETTSEPVRGVMCTIELTGLPHEAKFNRVDNVSPDPDCGKMIGASQLGDTEPVGPWEQSVEACWSGAALRLWVEFDLDGRTEWMRLERLQP